MHPLSLDPDMGYSHIKTPPELKYLCTILIIWVKYEYQKLSMGVCNSPGFFQEKSLRYLRALIP